MAAAYEISLSCAVCLELYDDPRILTCGHSFCFKCLQSLQNSSSYESVITCPKCKVKSRSGRASYTTNYELKSLVQEFTEASDTTSDDRNMYCTDCDTLMSGEDISGHNRHDVVSLDEALAIFKVMVEESTGDIDIMRSKLTCALDKSKDKLKFVKSIFHEIEIEVSRKKAEVLLKLEADIKAAETAIDNMMSTIPVHRELQTRADTISFIEECQNMLQRTIKQDFSDVLRQLGMMDRLTRSNKSIIKEIRNFEVVSESVGARKALEFLPSSSVTMPITTLPRLQFDHDRAGSWIRVSRDSKKIAFASHAKELIGDHHLGSKNQIGPPYVVLGNPRMKAGRLYWELEAARVAGGGCTARFGVTSSATPENCDPGVDAASWAVRLICDKATTTIIMQHADQQLYEQIFDAPSGHLTHRYGLLLDIDNCSLSVFDVKSSKYIYTFMNVNTAQGVTPAFGIYFDGNCTLRLVDPDEIHHAPYRSLQMQSDEQHHPSLR